MSSYFQVKVLVTKEWNWKLGGDIWINFIEAEDLEHWNFVELSLPIKNRFSSNVADRIIAPKDVHIWLPQTCECVTSPSKGIVRICLRLLRWKDYPGLSRRVQCIHKGPYKREAGGSKSEGFKDDVLLALGWSNGWGLGERWGGTQAQECLWPLEAGKCKERNSSLQKKRRPTYTLI